MYSTSSCITCSLLRSNIVLKQMVHKRFMSPVLVLKKSSIAISFGICRNFAQSVNLQSPPKLLTQGHERRQALVKQFYSSNFTKTDKDVRFGDGTIGELMARWERSLELEGVPEASLSVEAIVAHVLGTKMFYELGSRIKARVPNEKETEQIEQLCQQRLKRMPIQYIIGEWDFRDMTLAMKPPVFIPRSETEMFVELIIDHYYKDEELNVLEIGCGSGAISVAILRAFHKSRLIALDVLQDAVKLTRENAARYNVQGRLTVHHQSISCQAPEQLLQETKTKFDLIVSNPPYIFQEDLNGLEPEVIKFEDTVALNGGPDGADVIYDIIKLASRVLKPGGCIWLEVDTRHSEIVRAWLQRHPESAVRFICCFPDFTNRPRFIQLQYVGLEGDI